MISLIKCIYNSKICIGYCRTALCYVVFAILVVMLVRYCNDMPCGFGLKIRCACVLAKL